MPTGEASRPWPEFAQGMCDRLNAEQFLAVASPSVDFAAHVAALVDSAIESAEVGATSADNAKADPPSRTSLAGPPPPLQPSLRALAPLFRVQFTTTESIAMLQACIAVHNRCPVLALVDMCDDDDGYSYVLDLPDTGAPQSERCGATGLRETDDGPTTSSDVSEGGSTSAVVPNSCEAVAQRASTSANTGTSSNGSHTPSTPQETALRVAIASFLMRVVTGEEPRAAQGAAPAAGDLVEPRHGVVLGEACCAVTSNWSRLLHSCVEGESGGALVVFWSDRCPCCPGVLMLLDAIVHGLRLLANRLLEHFGSERGSGSLQLFPFMVCNIDENDYPPADWPSRGCCAGKKEGSPTAGEPQSVPSVVGYTHSGRLTRTSFKQPRTVENLVRFILDTCVGPTSVSFCFHSQFTEAALAMAAALDTDALMTVFDEKGSAYKRALTMFQEVNANAASLPADVTAAASELRTISQAHLTESCRSRHCRSVGEAVDQVLADLKARRPCAVPTRTCIDKDDKTVEESCCCLLELPVRSANASPGPFPLVSSGAAVSGAKRPREEDDSPEARDGATASNS